MSKVNDFLRNIQEMGAFISNKFYFNQLKDTPNFYEGYSGDYLVVNDNESGIHFTGIEKIAADLTDYGFGGSDSVTEFSGLQDTPSGYQGHSGDYLVVNDNESGIHFTGIEKIAADLTDYGFLDGQSSTIPSYTELPDATENDGKIVALGCDLYFSCDGEWIELGKKADQVTLPPGSDNPGCVENLSDLVLYENYKQQYIEDHQADIFERNLKGLPPEKIHEVCLYTFDSRNTVKIDETNFKWGIFYGDQNVNISALAYDPNIQFLEWRSSANNNLLGDINSPNTTLSVNQSMDIFAYFSGLISAESLTVDNLSSRIRIDYRNNILVLSNIGQVHIFRLEEDGSLALKQAMSVGSNFGIAIALSSDASKLAVSNYMPGTETVYIYEKDDNDSFNYKTHITRRVAAFSSDLYWVNNKLYTTSYQYFTIWEYTFSQDFSSATTTNTLYYNPYNIGVPTSTSGFSFGNKIHVLGNYMAIGAKGTVYFASYVNSQWTIEEGQEFNIIETVNTSLGNSNLIMPSTDQYYGGISFFDNENRIFVGYERANVNGNSNAGAVFEFSKVAGTWIHSQTIVSSNPGENKYFGLDITINHNQLFVLHWSNQNTEIEIFNIQ